MKANQPSKLARQWMRSGLAVLAFALASGCATQPPTAADEQLTVPAAAAERAYLGLAAESGPFQLADIRCEILVVDCFDMYCHICQAGAPHLNELYRLTQEHGLGNRIKFVGLGVGDSPLEVATYKQKLQVLFPVFPDWHTVIAQRFGPVRLPNLLILRNVNGRLEIIRTIPGALLDPDGLFTQLQADLADAQPRRWNDAAQAAQPTCGVNSAACRSGCPFSPGLNGGSAQPLF